MQGTGVEASGKGWRPSMPHEDNVFDSTQQLHLQPFHLAPAIGKKSDLDPVCGPGGADHVISSDRMRREALQGKKGAYSHYWNRSKISSNFLV